MNTDYKKIYENKKKFEHLLSKINKNNDLSENLILANEALYFAVKQNTGYYVSNKLEKFYCDCAKQIKTDISNIEYEKNSVLHVATLTCNIGGHSRVIERWVELAPEHQKNSVVLLNQTCEIPSKLKENTEKKNGQLYVLDKQADILEKAKQLRELAMHYEYIVLHIHMEDPTAVIAFGTEEFTRPVMFFNHADHLFWIGKSITDKLVDLREVQSITKKYRGIDDVFILPIPQEINNTKNIKTKEEARRDLNLPNAKKIILTTGSEFKFAPFKNKSLLQPLKEIITNIQDSICIAIGPSLKNAQWKQAFDETNGKIKAIGEINYNKEYFDYIKASDLIIDSWPLSGGTVIKDAITCKKPILSLLNPIGQCDYVLKSKCFCNTERELVQKACDILSNIQQNGEDYFLDINKYFQEETDIISWQNKLEKLYNSLPKKHSVKDLSSDKDINIIDDYSLLLNQTYSLPKKEKLKSIKLIKYYIKYYLYKYIIKNYLKRDKYLQIVIEQYLYQ